MNELSLIDSLFNDVLDSTPSVMYRAGVSAPRVDVTEDEGAYTLEMELPGRTENDVNIELDHDNLTISSKVCEVWAILAAIYNEYDFNVAAINVGEANASIASSAPAAFISSAQTPKPASVVVRQGTWKATLSNGV